MIPVYITFCKVDTINCILPTITYPIVVYLFPQLYVAEFRAISVYV